jgi:hypothetical protein
LFAHGWWFSPGTPASSTTKTGRHDIAEILLKVAFIVCLTHKIPSTIRVLTSKTETLYIFSRYCLTSSLLILLIQKNIITDTLNTLNYLNGVMVIILITLNVEI